MVVLGDCNAGLVKYDHDKDVAYFLDKMYFELLLPNISSPTQITSISATLIDNNFTNDWNNTYACNNFVGSSCSNFDISNT